MRVVPAADPQGVATRAYADPPYPQKARLYCGHRDYAGEVDHRQLLVALSSYDGWALSTSSQGALEVVAPLVSELGLGGVRMASWHRGARAGRGSGWEAVVYLPARPAGESDAFAYVSRPRLSDPDRVIGVTEPPRHGLVRHSGAGASRRLSPSLPFPAHRYRREGKAGAPPQAPGFARHGDGGRKGGAPGGTPPGAPLRLRRTVDLAITRRVASPQSPTPFRQAWPGQSLRT